MLLLWSKKIVFIWLRLLRTLEESGAMDYTIVVNASAAGFMLHPNFSYHILGVTIVVGSWEIMEKRYALIIYDDGYIQNVLLHTEKCLINLKKGRWVEEAAYPGRCILSTLKVVGEELLKWVSERIAGSMAALHQLSKLSWRMLLHIFQQTLFPITDGPSRFLETKPI